MKKTILLLILCMFFCAMGSIAIAEGIEICYVLNKEGNTTPMYSDVECTQQCGYIFNRKHVNVLKVLKNSTKIRLGELERPLYVKNEHTYDNDEELYKMETNQRAYGYSWYTGAKSIRDDGVYMYKDYTNLDDKEKAKNKGFNLIAEIDGFYFCEDLDFEDYGFVKKEDLEILGDFEKYSATYTIERVGFIAVKDKENVNPRSMPFFNAPIDMDAKNSFSHDSYASVLYKNGDWYEIRIDYWKVFVHKDEILRVELIENWHNPSNIYLKEGIYQAPKDLQPAIYCYVLQEGEVGSLHIHGAEGFEEQHYTAEGPAFYTVYIPDGAKIAIQGEGQLQTEIPFLDKDGEIEFEGSGQLYRKLHFPKIKENVEIELEVIPLLNDSYIRNRWFNGDINGINYLEEEHQIINIFHRHDLFIEFKNCRIHTKYVMKDE